MSCSAKVKYEKIKRTKLYAVAIKQWLKGNRVDVELGIAENIKKVQPFNKLLVRTTGVAKLSNSDGGRDQTLKFGKKTGGGSG